MTSRRDYYEILGVAKSATPEEIKRAYKKLAAKYHPDRNPGDEAAVTAFKECSEAFDVLGSEDKRARYDRFGHAGVDGSVGSTGSGFGEASDIFEAFGEMFGDLFGGSAGGRRRAGGRGRRGESLRTSVTIELLEAAVGCNRELEVQRRVACVTCVGTGAKPGTSPVTCDYCGGRGAVIQSQGFFRVQTTCPACQGAGKIIREKCTTCRGTRYQVQTSKLDVKIPAGVDNDMQLCLRGEGETGEGGGPNGDLYVDIRVNSHPLFERDGRHLQCLVPITYSQAALGADLEIPILTGKQQLTIPSGTQPGEIFRLRGYGMPDPQGGPRGDLLVKVQVEVPRKLNKKQEELLRQLAELDDRHVTAERKSFFETLKDYFKPAES